jgi:lipoyl(octanoyl) transferase
MGLARKEMRGSKEAPVALQVYLLGTVDFEALLRFQRLLHYEICGDPGQAALILCEHPPLITVGRHGSRAHIIPEPSELELRGWPVRWVNRGGGCWLHQPGQLAVYSLLPLDRLGLGVPAYQRRLGDIVQAWLSDFHVGGIWRDGGGWVGDRLLVGLGCAVQNWVSYFGMSVNINPVLDPYRLVRCSGRAAQPMTSLERERRGRIRPSLARERLIERFQLGFRFERVSLFTEHLLITGNSQRSTPPRVHTRK